MKKILTFLVIFLTVGIANAQTEAETLDWLNTKKTSFKYFLPPDINRVSEKWNDLVFHKDFISCKLNNKTINIPYNEIKEIFQTKNVPLTDDGYYIITIKTSQGISLDFWGKDYGFIEKYAKGLKHIATLKGAPLVDNDLF